MCFENFLYSPSDTFYHLAQTHISVSHKQCRRRIVLEKLFSKAKYVPFLKYEEEVEELENDSALFVNESDKEYFPPVYHNGPTGRIGSSFSEMVDSPWHENFGGDRGEECQRESVGTSNERRPACKDGKGKKKQYRKKKRTDRSKRQLFLDMQVELLKCVLPPVGLFCEYERQKRRR